MGLLSEDKKQLAKREAMTQIIFHGTNPDEADGQDCLVGLSCRATQVVRMTVSYTKDFIQSGVNIEIAGSCGMLWHAAECHGMLWNVNNVYVLKHCIIVMS